MTTKKTYAIGLDLGATTVKAGVVDRQGAILDEAVVETRAHRGPNVVIQQMGLALHDLFARRKQSECLGIGIGSPGIIRADEGIVLYPPNFKDWKEVELVKAIKKRFPIEVKVENDANCAALAEARFGVGVEHKDFLFVIWGTGVGGAIILNREIFRGPHGGAGEIGHVSVDYNGRVCNCGSKGCVEAYIGQRYLSQRTREILEAVLRDGLPSKINDLVDGDLRKIDPAIISQAAEEEDPTALEILEEAGSLLGYALASALNLLDLRVVVIGGGISAAPKFVYQSIEKTVKSRVLQPHKGGIRILRSKLGNPAGIVGAACLVI